ncbi:hypothetical protein CXB49_14510 [Chromobacterium sp. ATCC 53434]|nr:hypothetical protein CXB49_14510 [Chromobacterium sp. ATCC 53434]
MAEGGCGGRGAPGVRMSEHVVATISQETGVVAVVRALSHFLLARSLFVAQLRLGYCVEKAFMLVTSLFSANAQGDTRNHPAPFDLETWASQGTWRLACCLVSQAVRLRPDGIKLTRFVRFVKHLGVNRGRVWRSLSLCFN